MLKHSPIYLGRNSDSREETNHLVSYDGGGHLLTLARSMQQWHTMILHNLLSYEGSIVIIDPGGKYYNSTADIRRNMGNEVVRLDPFNVLSDESIDTFNPFDIFGLMNSTSNDEIRALIDTSFVEPTLDPIWRNAAVDLLIAMIRYGTAKSSDVFNPSMLHKQIFHDDIKLLLSTILNDERKSPSVEVRQTLESFLAWPDKEIIGANILAIAQQATRLFGSPQVQKATENTSFELSTFHQNESISVYLIVPLKALGVYSSMFRLWIGAFLLLIDNRPDHRHMKTLFILDCAAHLGDFPLLVNTYSTRNSRNLQIWSLWDSFSHLEALYPTQRLTASAAVLQNLGVSENEQLPFFEMNNPEPGQQVLSIEGRAPIKIATLDRVDKSAEARSTHRITFSPSEERAPIIMETLLTYPNSIVVLDPTGAHFASTADARRRMGQHIIHLSPFSSESSDTFNPFDALSFNNAASADNTQVVEELLMYASILVDPYWNIASVNFAVSVLMYLSAHKHDECSLPGFFDTLSNPDVVYDFAVALDNVGKQINQEAYQGIADFLKKGDSERLSILADIRGHIRMFASKTMRRVLSSTTFDLDSIKKMDSVPISVYITVPPTKLVSHKTLLRLWLGALLMVMESNNTLFILDSAADLGNFPPLLRAHKLLEKVSFWTLWDSLEKMQACYPTSWRTLVSLNSHVDGAQLNHSTKRSTFGMATFKAIPTSVDALVYKLLNNPGTVVAFDPTGSLYATTAVARQSMGHTIVRLDPFSAELSDSFNPFDVCRFTPSHPDDEIRALIETVFVEKSAIDSYWDHLAADLLAGTSLALAASGDCSIQALRRLFFNSDPNKSLGQLIEKFKQKISPEAYHSISHYLGLYESGRSRVLNCTQFNLSEYASPSVLAATRTTSFDLDRFYNGETISIYITISPTKLISHRRLLRLWIGSLLLLAGARAQSPEDPTLFLLDHAAMLGNFPLLVTARRLLANNGVKLWGRWNSLSELKACYPADWKTLISSKSQKRV